MISNKPSPNPLAEQVRQLQVLLAYDGSKHALAAVELLIDTFGQGTSLAVPSSTVTVVSVLPTQYISGYETLETSLEEIQNQLQAHGMPTTIEIKAGNPAAAINDYAQEICADLTLIGAKGLRATLGILLGGVAQQVVEYSCCPVLVVRAPYQGIRRILLITDGSIFSQQALDYLAQRRLPLPANSQVSVMHVLPPAVNPDTISRSWVVVPEAFYPPPSPPVDLEALEQEEESYGRKLLAQSINTLTTAGLKAESILVRGDAATEIIQYVRDAGIDLIVCGSRGLSSIQGWLLGSVSRKLVHYAGCSVLVVKTTDREIE